MLDYTIIIEIVIKKGSFCKETTLIILIFNFIYQFLVDLLLQWIVLLDDWFHQALQDE